MDGVDPHVLIALGLEDEDGWMDGWMDGWSVDPHVLIALG